MNDDALATHLNSALRLAQSVFDVPVALFAIFQEHEVSVKALQGARLDEVQLSQAALHTFVQQYDDEREWQRGVQVIDAVSSTTNSHYAFCACAPVRGAHGAVTGVLCIVDTQAHQLTAEFEQKVNDIATCVEVILTCAELPVKDSHSNRSHDYQAALHDAKIEVNRLLHDTQQSYATRIQKIIEVTKQALNVSTTSLWLKEDDNTLRCHAHAAPHGQPQQINAELNCSEHQAYWATLCQDSEIVAGNILEHSVLDSMRDSYLVPNKVASLLDIIVKTDTDDLGCLCIEVRDQQRAWIQEEIRFAHDVGSSISTLLTFRSQHLDLQQSKSTNATLNAIFNAASDVAIIATDANGVIEKFNLGAERLLGYDENDVVGKQTPLLFHNHDEIEALVKELDLNIEPPAFFELFRYAAVNSTLSHRHWKYVRKDGISIDVLLKLSPIVDDNGQAQGYLGIAVDVTDELRQQAELVLQESRLRALFELCPVGIALNDFNTGQFIDGNSKLLEPTGYSRDEFTALSYFDLTPETYFNDEQKMLESLKATGRYGPFEKEYIRKDGTRYPILLNGVLVEDVDGNQLIWSIIEDISERKHLDELKNQFISTVSHELRTPLTSVSGALSLLESGRFGSIPDKAQHMLRIASNNSKRLTTLINDLLDFEKLNSGSMSFDLQRYDLHALLEVAIEDNASFAEKHDVSITYTNASRDAGIVIQVDEQRFQQIMNNLLSNAIKFSPQGQAVEIEVVTFETQVRVLVKDRGEGISEEFKSRIFKRFQQATGHDRKQTGGTGLGLAITKELVQAMNGAIDFVSTENGGSCFYFDLPCLTASDKLEQADSSSGMSHVPTRRALVVEDDSEACEILAETYVLNGFSVSTAENIESARSAIRANQFDLISLDLSLPDGEGLDFLHEVRANPLNKHAKVVIISGKAVDKSLISNYRSTQLDWLVKPVNSSDIRNVIAQFALKPSHKRVLHVEDDDDLQQVVQSMLSPSFDVKKARNCKQAKAQLTQHRFDLVLLDIGLPDGCGIELISHIKANQGDVPIVVLSGQVISTEHRARLQSVIMKTELASLDLETKLTSILGQS